MVPVRSNISFDFFRLWSHCRGCDYFFLINVKNLFFLFYIHRSIHTNRAPRRWWWFYRSIKGSRKKNFDDHLKYLCQTFYKLRCKTILWEISTFVRLFASSIIWFGYSFRSQLQLQMLFLLYVTVNTITFILRFGLRVSFIYPIMLSLTWIFRVPLQWCCILRRDQRVVGGIRCHTLRRLIRRFVTIPFDEEWEVFDVRCFARSVKVSYKRHRSRGHI